MIGNFNDPNNRNQSMWEVIQRSHEENRKRFREQQQKRNEQKEKEAFKDEINKTIEKSRQEIEASVNKMIQKQVNIEIKKALDEIFK